MTGLRKVSHLPGDTGTERASEFQPSLPVFFYNSLVNCIVEHRRAEAGGTWEITQSNLHIKAQTCSRFWVLKAGQVLWRIVLNLYNAPPALWRDSVGEGDQSTEVQGLSVSNSELLIFPLSLLLFIILLFLFCIILPISGDGTASHSNALIKIQASSWSSLSLFHP